MFRLLKADEIETRVNQISQKGLSLLLYKTARTDANLLDETVGPMNWQNDFKLIDGILFGGIGIKTDNEYVWKWDCGVESYTEKEKGRASDAFKRAGFKCGIGRELYTAPFISFPFFKASLIAFLSISGSLYLNKSSAFFLAHSKKVSSTSTDSDFLNEIATFDVENF